jgi:hypothetical protein
VQDLKTLISRFFHVNQDIISVKWHIKVQKQVIGVFGSVVELNSMRCCPTEKGVKECFSAPQIYLFQTVVCSVAITIQMTSEGRSQQLWTLNLTTGMSKQWAKDNILKTVPSECVTAAHFLTPAFWFLWSTPERVMAREAQQSYDLPMQTSTSPLVELYEKRMRRFNLTVILAAMVSLVLAFLLILTAWGSHPR